MKKIKDILDVILLDDESSEGGISFAGETVKDFIEEVEIDENETVSVLNDALKDCGIKPIEIIYHKKEMGWKVENVLDDSVWYIGEYGWQGVYYKDSEAFNEKKGVCYINEYGFENSEENATTLFNFGSKASAAKYPENNPYISEGGYTYQEILDLVDGNEELAKDVFSIADWAAIETYLNEMEYYQ